MEALFLPVLSHFQNKNAWTASVGALRYRVAPDGEALNAEVWQGPWCYELSCVEETRSFPMTDEGVQALGAWVTEWAERMNARTKETLEETIARRDAVAAERQANAAQSGE